VKLLEKILSQAKIKIQKVLENKYNEEQNIKYEHLSDVVLTTHFYKYLIL
jgi:hypothetical protein